MNLATATFSGKIARISPVNSKYTGEVADRPWIIWLEVELQQDKKPVLVRFQTKQKPLPYLISEGRIFVEQEFTVMGQLSSISIPTTHSDSKMVIHLKNVSIPDNYIWYSRVTSYHSTAEMSETEMFA